MMSMADAFIDELAKTAWLNVAIPAALTAVNAVKDAVGNGTPQAPKAKIDTGAPAVPSGVSANSSVTA